MFIAGGFDGTDYTDMVQHYQSDTDSWKREASGLNEERFDHACKGTVIRNKFSVIAVGGWNKDGVLNTTEIMQ